MKVRYDESFLFPQGQEDFGRSLVFPQGQLHGLSGMSPVDYLAVIGSVSGRKYIDENNFVLIEYKIVTPESARTALLGFVFSSDPEYVMGAGPDELTNLLYSYFSSYSPRPGMYYLVKGSSLEQDLAAQKAKDDRDLADAAARRKAAADQAAAATAAQQAAAAAAAAAASKAEADRKAQIQATSQAAAQPAAAAAKPEVSMATSSSLIAVDGAIQILKSKGKYTEGMSIPQMSAILTADQGGNPVKIQSTISYNDAVSRLKAANSWVENMNVNQMQGKLTELNDFNPIIVIGAATTAAAVAATNTQTTATNTATGTVQTTDKVTGTTSTADVILNKVIVSTVTGQVVSGTGTVTAGGVTTSVDQKTGVVTTQNTQTGVATQTDASTGKTVTATQVTGTAATGGTFIMPDGKTVTTDKSITSTGGLDTGKIALFGLLGFLLLRGAVK
jgi:hypothetical protein